MFFYAINCLRCSMDLIILIIDLIINLIIELIIYLLPVFYFPTMLPIKSNNFRN
jgi:hypothetical protein